MRTRPLCWFRGARRSRQAPNTDSDQRRRESIVRGAVLYGPGDVRYDESPEPTIIDPADAIIRMSVTCICGSDLWPYRGLNPTSAPAPMGHEYLRHRRGGGPGRYVHQARSVRDRIVCRLRQHVPALSRRLSLVVRAPRVDHGCAGAAAARADGGRHACRDDRGPSGGPRPQLSGFLAREGRCSN